MCPTSCSLVRHSRAAAAVSYDSLLEVGFRSLHEALDTTTPGVGWSSTSLPPWPSSSANSSWKAPTRASTLPALAGSGYAAPC